MISPSSSNPERAATPPAARRERRGGRLGPLGESGGFFGELLGGFGEFSMVTPSGSEPLESTHSLTTYLQSHTVITRSSHSNHAVITS